MSLLALVSLALVFWLRLCSSWRSGVWHPPSSFCPLLLADVAGALQLFILLFTTPLSVLLVSARPYLERNCVCCRSWSALTLSIAGCHLLSRLLLSQLRLCAGRSWPVCDLAWCCRSCDGARCPWLRRRCRRNVALCWRRTVLHDGRTGKASFRLKTKPALSVRGRGGVVLC